jgi:hypothetical protein
MTISTIWIETIDGLVHQLCDRKNLRLVHGMSISPSVSVRVS